MIDTADIVAAAMSGVLGDHGLGTICCVPHVIRPHTAAGVYHA